MRLLAVLALWTLPAAAVELGPEEMRAFGQEALLRGYGAQALEISDALLARDGTDAAALVLRAQALRVLNRLPESAAAGRAAWAAATTPGTRYMAATATAQALSLQGRRGLAQLWLRRAVEVAPSTGAARQALDDLRYVRGENPLRLDFDLRLRPTDNVNGGTRVTSFDLLGVSFPVPGELQALGGLSWGFGLDGSWRIAADPVAETALTFALDQSGVILSDTARALAPEAESGDYALSRLGLGIERRRRDGRVLSFALGKNWYGGAALSATYGVAAEWPTAFGHLTFGLQREARADQASASSTQARAGVQWRLRGPGGDRWTAGLDLGRAVSEADSVDRREAVLSLAWAAAQPVAGMELAARVGVGGADYASGRAEGRLSASLEAQLDGLSRAGFAPVVTLSWARSNSNRLINATESLGLGLSLRSRF